MTQWDKSSTTRRDMLALTAAGGALLASGGAVARTSTNVPTTPDEWLRAYMLMRGALDERLVIGFISGRYYGVVDGESRALYGVIGATFSRYRRRPDGAYDGISKEIPYFYDLATGKVIDTFRNPYTNEDVAVEHGGYPPARIIIGRDLKLSVPTPMPGLTLEDDIVGREILGDDVFLTEQTVSAFQAPGMTKPVRYSDVVTIHASLADLQRPGVSRVRAQNSYVSTVSWRPWLKMGDRPGHLTGVGYGGYGASVNDLPKTWRDAVAVRHPEVLKDPASALPAF